MGDAIDDGRDAECQRRHGSIVDRTIRTRDTLEEQIWSRRRMQTHPPNSTISLPQKR